MNTWTKVAATAAALTITVTSGAAWATAGSPAKASAPAESKALGAGVTETKFIPIAPCRVHDSRVDSIPAKPASGVPAPVNVVGDVDFTSQGGSSTGCGIPSGGFVSAIEATVTAVDPTDTGYLRAFPVAEPAFGATLLNYSQGESSTNTGALILCVSDCTSDIQYVLHGANADVVVDVQGYYINPMAAHVVTGALVANESSRVDSVVDDAGLGTYTVTFDRDVHRCALSVTSTLSNRTIAAAPGATNDAVDVTSFSNTGNPADTNFYLEVTC
ncbi:MAG: hypothetical protein JWM47_2752 [Acidimicrobiales bacterium]|nr:hypothetical protein [Acidimicrobiales bacterium]